ncbi:MAG: hypothetical protein A3C90_03330 [Candidatus Magasanikbacteria bacterium RIFCSPHIGHO2_02_FULL_51_14]|uniref:Uncharacterized protein n=1 Tax=Candidatus Magasanikbacteria bacterium RIFCSPHIGHO2_02_FULL_51_14 TaxID=1798683 RepID=A0A1F6MQS4_9BACT|nr:MAG: hypothetical protein A3C90_03330 [Candidatus Magasanikbacteria bacterium RIFCSPHIGHO2_02_FULL_51_14]
MEIIGIIVVAAAIVAGIVILIRRRGGKKEEVAPDPARGLKFSGKRTTEFSPVENTGGSRTERKPIELPKSNQVVRPTQPGTPRRRERKAGQPQATATPIPPPDFPGQAVGRVKPEGSQEATTPISQMGDGYVLRMPDGTSIFFRTQEEGATRLIELGQEGVRPPTGAFEALQRLPSKREKRRGG